MEINTIKGIPHLTACQCPFRTSPARSPNKTLMIRSPSATVKSTEILSNQIPSQCCHYINITNVCQSSWLIILVFLPRGDGK
jgi:hypothetical protein